MIRIAGPSRARRRELRGKEKELFELAQSRMRRGFAPPPEIYRIEYRNRIDWLQFPSWAWPTDPELFDGCCHEG
jgi:hypothetical protein